MKDAKDQKLQKIKEILAAAGVPSFSFEAINPPGGRRRLVS